LILAGLLSILRQTGVLSVDTEVPLLTMTIGLLWTSAHLFPLKQPSWILPDEPQPATQLSNKHLASMR
jgi:hypothetical protein